MLWHNAFLEAIVIRLGSDSRTYAAGRRYEQINAAYSTH